MTCIAKKEVDWTFCFVSEEKRNPSLFSLFPKITHSEGVMPKRDCLQTCDPKCLQEFFQKKFQNRYKRKWNFIFLLILSIKKFKKISFRGDIHCIFSCSTQFLSYRMPKVWKDFFAKSFFQKTSFQFWQKFLHAYGSQHLWKSGQDFSHSLKQTSISVALAG